MIDLSFLSEEEQETILAVLKRDAELKKFEEHRIQNLQKSVKDKSQLRYLTGEWFYEAKQVRHQDRIHGSDIIRASMRHTHKPLTILELSQMLPEKSSFISNENKEVFIPPVLRGLLQEPRMQPRIKKYQNQNPDETPQDASKPVSHSPVKRKNPFNSEFSACHTVKENNSQVVDGAVSETRTLNEEPLPPSETCSSYVSNIRQNCNDSSANLNPSAVSSSSQDCFVEVDWSGCRQTDADVPQGILNNLPTDSLFCQLDLQSLSSLDSPTETWVDPKQARFSSTIGQRRVEWHDGKELGEHSLLDTDSTAPSEMENNHLNNGNTTASTQRSLFNHSQTASQEGELKNEARLQEQDVVKHQAFGDVSEQSHSELICPSVSSLMSAEESGYDDSSSPILSPLKQLSSRSMSLSKSLESLTSHTRDEKSKTESSEQMSLSVDDASALSNSKQTKTSLSVPVLQQNETESDSTFGTNLGWRRNISNSTSNISLSSGMASMSSQVSGSLSSINPADCSDFEIQGSIQFAVNYIQKLGEFHIFVVHCKDLAMADTKKSRCDPYVKCYLLPDKSKLGKRKTTVKKKTLNPTYNEILKFTIKMEELKTQNLNISVWHNDTLGRNSFLGEVDLDLSEWDFSNTQINEHRLKTRVLAQTSTPSPSHLMDSRGQMRVALRFLPKMSHSNRTSRIETGEMQIWVKDCKNLPSVTGGMIDPFVKCTVLPDTSRKSRQKTRVVKRTANPMFNHTMVYDGFQQEDLREACVELTVWDHDRLNNHYIGGLRLGLGTGKSFGTEVVWMDSTTEEANLWDRMLKSDGEWVEDVLPLRMLVMAKSMSK
ncbi:synaptotagmin-like protein 2 isoform X4 [Channa argus]|uniref:synaptotagmin-like protein 2 isoform X4 n=1 Tax=Channa argus TaxID=215402 RepID=UPI003522CA1B